MARATDGTLVYVGGIRLPWGTMAERIAAPAALSAPVPDGTDPVVAAAAMNPGMSSWMPLTSHIAATGTPSTVLVLGATGAAGGLAVQNARALGVERIIAAGHASRNSTPPTRPRSN